MANLEIKKLYKFRYLKRNIKVRLYKSKVLPVLTNAAVPLNICSQSQRNCLQLSQNKAIRWITNLYYPNICNINNQQENLMIDSINDWINRLAQKVWFKIEAENSPFFEETLNIPIIHGHSWFKSSYAQTFEWITCIIVYIVGDNIWKIPKIQLGTHVWFHWFILIILSLKIIYFIKPIYQLINWTAFSFFISTFFFLERYFIVIFLS